MAKSGDYFISTLKKAHLNWGNYRHTNSRGIVLGEGYLQIPAKDARRINIYNNNFTGSNTIHICNSSDGFLTNVQLKATGCVKAGAIYAKQFHGNGNLRLLGDWFNHIDAHIGDRIKILWITSNEILITKI